MSDSASTPSPPKQGLGRMLIYAAALGALCALLLTAAGRFTRPYREANEKAEKVRHILNVLAIPLPAGAGPEEQVAVFTRKVQTQRRGDRDWYVYAGGAGSPAAVAVPFAGAGVWGPIQGFLALDPGLAAIHGITFYDQEETPGLGGEIGSRAFRDRFQGKRIAGVDGKPGIRIRRGADPSSPNEVDALSGATMTCERVEAILDAAIAHVLEEGKDCKQQ